MRPALTATFGPLGSLVGTVSIALCWAFVDVYVRGHFDPKFGAFGEVLLVLFMAALGGLVGAVGAYPAHLALLGHRELSPRLVPFLTGVAAGVVLAFFLGWYLQLEVAPFSGIAALIAVVAPVGFFINIVLCILVRKLCRNGYLGSE